MKKEIDPLRSEGKEQRLELKEQIVNLKSEIGIQNIFIPNFATDVKSTIGEGKTPLDLETKELWEKSIKVLSTLWKHQQQYAPQFWEFLVGPRSPNHRTYTIGVGETLKLGLTEVNPENGMVFLTVQGIEYCKKNKEKPKDDWTITDGRNLIDDPEEGRTLISQTCRKPEPQKQQPPQFCQGAGHHVGTTGGAHYNRCGAGHIWPCDN